MPTYEYRCNKCGKSSEVLQKITDEPLKDCPSCKEKGSLSRGFGGGIGLSFQGSGFYITDYATPSPSKGNDSKNYATPSPSKGNDSKNSCCPCGKSKGSCSSS